MSTFFQIYLYAAAAVVGYMVVVFLIAWRLKRNDLADVAWGLGFVVVAWAALGLMRLPLSGVRLISLMLVTVWGLRLSWHIFQRFRKKSEEDYRYLDMRKAWGTHQLAGSFWQVFMLQGFLLLLVISPVLVVVFHGEYWRTATTIGFGVWLFGFVFEAVSDRQLRQFLAKSENEGKIMQSGLWRYSRHPNYFGEVTQWWGFGIAALGYQQGLIGLIGPVVITFLIVKVSGIPLLENKYRDNKDYQEYARRTSVLIPLPNKMLD